MKTLTKESLARVNTHIRDINGIADYKKNEKYGLLAAQRLANLKKRIKTASSMYDDPPF